jgi:hypothetical protein
MKPQFDKPLEPAPLISQYSETLYGLRHGAESFNVAFLPGRIALYGTPGNQFFLNKGNHPPQRLREIFKTREDYMERALLHKETSTDQTKFLSSLDRLLSEKLIDAHNKQKLREFILKCDCPPRRIREKLRAMGYEHILARLEFERYPDELMNTIEAMEKFVAQTKITTEAPAAKESRRGREPAGVRPMSQRTPARSS